MALGTIATATIGCALGLGIAWLIHREAVRAAEKAARDAQSRLSQELVAKRDRLEDAMDDSRLAMWELDMRAGTVNLSANWWALMGGIPRESPLPIGDLIDRVPDGEQADCWVAVRAVLRGTSSFYDVEHRVRRDDGSVVWIRSRGAVSERSADGRVVRMAGTNLDITARRKAEAAMGESEAKLRLVADGLPFMVAILDADLHVVFANRRFGDAFGTKPEALSGRSLRGVVGAALDSLVRSRMDLLRSGATVTSTGKDGAEEIRLVPQLEADQLVRIAILSPDNSSFTHARNAATLGDSADSFGHTNQ
jgi:PAS domain-containing protein